MSVRTRSDSKNNDDYDTRTSQFFIIIIFCNDDLKKKYHQKTGILGFETIVCLL
jgi:hypothetical protein